MDKEKLKFYSIGRGSLNLDGKFYYGLDYAITDFMMDLEQQCKKQKEVIDKSNKYLHTRGIQRCYNGRHYRGLDGLQVQVLEDILKEVSE